jgi:hypothetical protein
LAGDNLGFIYDLNADFDDYFTNISAITQASEAVLTVNASGIMEGDRVVVQNVVGMTEINNFDPETDSPNFVAYIVKSATPTSITLNVDSTLFTPYTSGGSISKVISFKAETIPFNPYRDKGYRCYISHIEFLVDNNGGSLRVDVLADEEQTPFKKNVLVKPRRGGKGREWITVSVDNEANFMTFVMKQESPATQVRITSIRIHCQQGGLTSG